MTKIMEELDSREAYKREIYAPYYVCSYATHCFNLANQKNEIYWESKRLPNMRLHVLFVSPAGYMKSYYLGTMGGDKYAIFKETGIQIGYEQSLCLPAGQYVNMADGSHKNVEDVEIGDMVLHFDGKDFVPTEVTATHVMPANELLKVTLEDGRNITLTPNHPMYTLNGWKEPRDIKIGDAVLVPRVLNIKGENLYTPEEARLLGYMLADGNFRQLTFACDNEFILADFTKCVESIGCRVGKTKHVPAIEYVILSQGSGKPSKARQLFDRMGISKYCVREEKYIPEDIFKCGNDVIASLLRGLFSGDGHYGMNGVELANISEHLIRQSQQLLIRLGIISKVRDNWCIWKLFISNQHDIIRYFNMVGFSYPVDVIAKLPLASAGCIPGEVYDLITTAMGDMSWRQLGKLSNSTITQSKYKKNRIHRSLVQQIANILNDDNLKMISGDNIAWMRVVKIEHIPGELVYNLSTEDHTFLAGDIFLHNTEAGFIGTISNMNGVNIPTEGAAMTFRHGMLLIDEFSAITNAMKVQYNAQMDSQLLAALDHGNVYKRLGAGKIEYKTNLSLWAGVQPARYDLTSGLGRRMCFLLFLPTRYDNEQLMETMARTRNIRPDEGNMQDLWRSINAWYNEMYKIEKVEFDDSVLKVYKNMKLFSYESSYFDRLILGYHLATYGPEKHMCVSADNKDLLEILQREKKWRDQIMQGVDFVQIERLIQSAGIPCEGDKYKITKRELVSEAIMVGWNAQQVHEMLIQMLKFGIISVKGNEVTLEN